MVFARRALALACAVLIPVFAVPPGAGDGMYPNRQATQPRREGPQKVRRPEQKAAALSAARRQLDRLIESRDRRRSSGAQDLSSSALAADVDRRTKGREPVSTTASDGYLRVEVVYEGSPSAAQERVQAVGGRIEGDIPGQLLQALVPADRIAELENAEGIIFVRPPKRVNHSQFAPADEPEFVAAAGAVVGQEVAKMRADDWHVAGQTGQNVKIGLIDIFSTNTWNAARAVNEVPAESGTFCMVFGSSCNVFTVAGAGQQHGAAVAEIAHEMAPGSQMYLATAATATDLQAVVNYFFMQGVKVVSMSLLSSYDGPGNGTGPIASVVNDAVAKGMTWFNPAGNASGAASVHDGSYWRETFVDDDDDGFHDFADGSNLMAVTCNSGVLGLRWDDWTDANANVTDFDLYAFDSESFELVAFSEEFQGSGGGTAPPLENFPGEVLLCDSGVAFIAIALFEPGSGANDVLEFQLNLGLVEFWSNPFAAALPIVDSSNAGVLGLGAIDPPAGTTIADYSSWGPTNDNRSKPDVVAAAGVSNFTFGTFGGTSASAPAAAGAGALVLGADLATTPAQLGAFLRNNSVDRGVVGTDNVHGRGELILPDPPVVPTPTPTATPSASPTPTPSSTPSATPTTTPSATPTASPTTAPTSTPSPTPTPSASSSPSPTPTSTPTTTPSASPTQTPTATPVATPAATPTPRSSTDTSDLGTPSKTQVLRGETVTIAEDGYAGNKKLSITFQSDPVSLGTVQSNEAGSFSTVVTIPTTASVGDHDIVVRGLNASGGTHTVTFPVTVVVASTAGAATLPATGLSIALIALWAVFLVVFGCLVVGGTGTARSR